jgi:hypothetical protein
MPSEVEKTCQSWDAGGECVPRYSADIRNALRQTFARDMRAQQLHSGLGSPQSRRVSRGGWVSYGILHQEKRSNELNTCIFQRLTGWITENLALKSNSSA